MRFPPPIARFLAPVTTAAAFVTLAAVPTAVASPETRSTAAWPRGVVVVGYRTPAALRTAVARFDGRVLRSVRALRVAEVRPRGDARKFAQRVERLRGIRYVHRLASRTSDAEPGIAPALQPGGAYQWQYAATRAHEVPGSVLRAAAGVTIAVVDTGGDVTAPDLAAKSPSTHSLLASSPDVTDVQGHGTFVSSLAAGSITNGEGVAGFGGDAKLLVIQAGHPDGSFTDVDVANAIVYAVDHGAKIVNLSLGGPSTTLTEQSAVDYAAQRDVLLVAAAGNAFLMGNPVSYPAALLQPVGSNGQGGRGLAVGASTLVGTRAVFSNTGTYISLAAPGEQVFGALSSRSNPTVWPRTALPGSSAGIYGYSSGTSFAAPEVAGAAALVWGAKPQLSALEVASILKATASGKGSWNAELGYGILDVAAAVARAQSIDPSQPKVTVTGSVTGARVALRWSSAFASRFRVSMSRDGAAERVLVASTSDTSATYDLDVGHRYSFTVTGIDAYGVAARSAPFKVSLAQVPAALSLRASRVSGAHPLRVRLTADLRLGRTTFSTSGRTIVLESFDGSAWKRFARAETTAGGEARWTVTFRRGVYRLRARFAGGIGLAGASSAPVTLRVR